MDKRIIKTRRALGDALIQLLQQQAFYQITIRQITEKAGVAYSTFFRNFDSIEALLLSHLEEFLQEIKILNNASPDDSFRDASRKNAHALFEHVEENQDLYRILLTSSVLRPMLDDFKQDLFNQQLELLQTEESQTQTKLPIELLVHSLVSLSFSMIEWWLTQETEISADTMSLYYEELGLPLDRYAN